MVRRANEVYDCCRDSTLSIHPELHFFYLMSARRLLCSVDFVEEINRDRDHKLGDNADEQYY